jgi:hypothetical protein
VRTPSPTFRDELKAYQRRLPALTRDNDHWKGRLAHEVIAQWIDHTECELIWTTIRPLLKVEITPGQFIKEIIFARFDAEQLSIIAAKAPNIEATMRARTKRHLQKKEYAQLGHENTLLDDLIERRAQFGREKTGPRLDFMRRLSAGFLRWCGQPLDNVVRVLTEIAFGDPITTEAVRAARSPRARRCRGTRPQK